MQNREWEVEGGGWPLHLVMFPLLLYFSEILKSEKWASTCNFVMSSLKSVYTSTRSRLCFFDCHVEKHTDQSCSCLSIRGGKTALSCRVINQCYRCIPTGDSPKITQKPMCNSREWTFWEPEKIQDYFK